MDNSKTYEVLVNFFHNTTLNLKFILILTLEFDRIYNQKKFIILNAIIIIIKL